jgi:hypothetical protein
MLYYKTPYNPSLAHIYDPIKVEAIINESVQLKIDKKIF